MEIIEAIRKSPLVVTETLESYAQNSQGSWEKY
jgi:hypothetical protein